MLIVHLFVSMHTLICVTFSLPPGVKGWLRLLLVAFPGLFCLPFFSDMTTSHHNSGMSKHVVLIAERRMF